MSEHDKILKRLLFWHSLFVLLFIVFSLFAMYMGSILVRDLHTITRCNNIGGDYRQGKCVLYGMELKEE